MPTPSFAWRPCRWTKLAKARNLHPSSTGSKAARGRDVHAFPSALSGYLFATRDDALEHAEPIPPERRGRGRIRARLAVSCVFGMLERDGDHLYNAAPVGPGVLGGVVPQDSPALHGRGPLRRPRRPPIRGAEVDGLRVACTSATTEPSPRVPGC
ncbi:MAG: hypothetical protein WKF75_10765 [Singulisphaera sp.]